MAFNNNSGGVGIGAIMSAVLAVLVAITVMLPIITNAIDTNETTYNNATEEYRYVVDGNDDYSFITSNNYQFYQINGEYINMATFGGAVITTDKCRVQTAGHFLALYDDSGVRIQNVNNSSYRVECTYDASDKLFTFTTYTDLNGDTVDTDKTVSYNVENIIYLLSDGDYCRITTEGGADAPANYYVNELSQVIAGGAYTSGALDTSYFAEGTTVYVGNASYTASATATTTDVIDGVIKGSTYTITVTDGVDSESFTPYTVFVPAEVSGHTDYQNTLNTLLELVPLLGIIGVVFGCIFLIALRRA